MKNITDHIGKKSSSILRSSTMGISGNSKKYLKKGCESVF